MGWEFFNTGLRRLIIAAACDADWHGGELGSARDLTIAEALEVLR